MTSTRRDETISIHGYSTVVTAGRASVRTVDRGGRVRRATSGLAIAWAAALGTAFIPVAHVLLVPGFLAFGVFLFVTRIRAASIVETLRGTCPDCGVEQAFEAGGRWELPRALACSVCGRALTARQAA